MSTNVEARRAIEAILMVADQPIEPNLLAQVCEVSAATVEEICRDLAAEYEADGRGFVLARVAGGYRYQSHPDMAAYVERFVLDGQSARLSAAALETLAIVAYKQPISRAQVASIRGVSVDGVMKTLQGRGYIAEVGRDAGPGNAVLFGTTSLFLERLGLDSVDELPALGAFVPGADVVEQLERTLRVSDDPDAVPPVITEEAADEALDAVDAAEVVVAEDAATVDPPDISLAAESASVELDPAAVDERDAADLTAGDPDRIEAPADAGPDALLTSVELTGIEEIGVEVIGVGEIDEIGVEEIREFGVVEEIRDPEEPLGDGGGGGNAAGFRGGEAEGSAVGGIGGFAGGVTASSSGAAADDPPHPAGEA